MRQLPRSFFEEDAVTLAPKLLGKIVKRGACSGIIVEVEAYALDPASHGYHDTPRAKLMRETFGHWYVAFTYGVHWCTNVTCNKSGPGAVLIRAVEPVDGIALMKQRRKKAKTVHDLTNGPGKFAQAFGVNGSDNGKHIEGEFAVYDAPVIPKENIGISKRIGITVGVDYPWRFYIKNNPFVGRTTEKLKIDEKAK